MNESFDKQEELGVDGAFLEEWSAMAPPSGFADRVLAARVEAGARHRRMRRVMGVALVAAAVLVVGIPWVWSHGRPASGAVRAAARTTVALRDRAVAVLEPGSDIGWTVDVLGRAHVDQLAGSVFYRVDKGAKFEIETPAGNVSVRGTCFRVEVTDMNAWKGTKPAVGGAVVGAALTVAVVTVYEGAVDFSTAKGAAHITAGQWSWGSGGVAPSRPTDVAVAADNSKEGVARTHGVMDIVDPVVLRATNASQAKRIASLEAELQAERTRKDGSFDYSDETSFYPQTPEELRELAKTCTVRADYPPVEGDEAGELKEDEANRIGATSEEVRAINDALKELQAKQATRIRQLYVDATGETEAAKVLTAKAMLGDLGSKKMGPTDEGVVHKISQERAGLMRPPANWAALSPTERAWRFHINLGDELQELVAKRLGAERAATLRAAGKGWPWGRNSWGGCAQ